MSVFDRFRLSFAAPSSTGLSRRSSRVPQSGKGSTLTSKMVTAGLVTTGHDVEKKCSLLGRFVFNSYDRRAYTNQIKHNLPTYLNTSEKVRLKVGRHSLTVTDRTIWQNKLERIPNSLILDSHVDQQSPRICYFVNEMLNNRFQVLAFLCKTVEDSHKLVNNCPSMNKTRTWYDNSNDTQRISHPEAMTQRYQYTSSDDNRGTVRTQPQRLRMRESSVVGYMHSSSRSSSKPSNHNQTSKDRNPALVNNFVSAVQQYDSDSSLSKSRRLQHKTIQHNTDGVARIVVGGNDTTDTKMSPYQNGLTIVGNSSRENTLRKNRSKSPKPVVEFPTGTYNSLRMIRSPTSPRKSGDGSQSPDKHFDFPSAGTNQVEEDFKFVMTGMEDVESSPVRGVSQERQLPHQLQITQLQDHTNLDSTNYGTGKRRRGQYRSIKEYEAAQKQGAVTTGLQPMYGTENIKPQMSLMLTGNQYSSQDTAQRSRTVSPGTENMVKKVGSGWQFIPGDETGGAQNGLRLVQGGTFNQANACNSVRRPRTAPSHNIANVTAQRDGTLQRQNKPTQLDIQPQQMSNSLQIYSQPNIPPKYNVKTHGRGDNFLKKESLEVDDDHKYYRQHGQRVKKTHDGGQHLYLDNRMAETNDVIGNQMVQGKHAQKVHSGESVGKNHRSKFHSEVRVSHQISRPANGHQPQGFPVSGSQPDNSMGLITRQNSQPVNVTTHQWPSALSNMGPIVHFNGPEHMFRFPNHFGRFPTDEPMQRFFKPELNPHNPQIVNPGFQRFFESINNFGPQAQNPFEPLKHKEGQLSVTSPQVESPSDNESEASSIRSSASAYWPAELRFPTNTDQEEFETKSRYKPGMKLRRKAPGVVRQPIGHNPHHKQRLLL